MLKIIYSIYFVIFSVIFHPKISLSDETINHNELVKRGFFYYKKFTDVPFTGKVKGQINGTLKKGIYVGPYEEYYENGQLKKKGNYVAGFQYVMSDMGFVRMDAYSWQDGLWKTFYSDGKIKYQGTYKKGMAHGYERKYSRDGDLKYDCKFLKNFVDGKCHMYKKFITYENNRRIKGITKINNVFTEKNF